MKYIIDVEKIEGTDLWKAKEFNTLVFDKNGLMKLMALEDELGDYYKNLREEIYSKKREIELLVKTHKKLRDEKIELRFDMELQGKKIDRLKKECEELKKYNNYLEKEWKDFDNICSRLKNENEELKKENKELSFKLKTETKGQGFLTSNMKLKEEEIDRLKKEYKDINKYNVVLKSDLRVFDETCAKLLTKNAELKEMYEEKCLEVKSLLDTGKLPSNSNYLTIELHKEENVPVEEVVDKKRYNKVIGSHDDTVIDESAFIDDYSLKIIKRLNHTIKCQKGMLKKQGKDISRLQRENKKLKEKCRYIENEKSWWNKEYIELKKENDELTEMFIFGKDN